jgi:AmmeMemoRadiSam system protein B
MINALRKVEAERKESICYVISGDLAHIGPKFEDPAPIDESQLRQSHAGDMAILECARRADMNGYFDVIARERDRRRICGLPPTYTTLSAFKPSSGKLLHYGRYVDPDGFESVSFASMAFA